MPKFVIRIGNEDECESIRVRKEMVKTRKEDYG